MQHRRVLSMAAKQWANPRSCWPFRCVKPFAMPSPPSVRPESKCRWRCRRRAKRSSWRFNEFKLRRRRNSLLIDQFSPLINELGHDTHRDLLNALRADLDTHWAGHALQLGGGGQLLLGEVLENGAGLARTADHAQEEERLMYPVLEHQGVVPVPARDD